MNNTPLTIGVIVIAALAIPVAMNACGDYQDRKALRILTGQHITSGVKAIDSKNYEMAETAFSAALQLSPTDAKARHGLAHSRAARILEGNASTKRSDAVRLVYSFEDALASDAANAAVYRLALAQLYGALGQNKVAHEWYAKATSQKGATAKAWQLRGRFELGEGKAKDAIKSLTEAIKLDAKLGEAHLYMGDAHMKDAKLADAAKSYTKATELSPTATAWHRLGEVQLRQNEPAKGYQSLGKAADLHASPAKNASLMKLLGIAAFKVKRFDEAVRFLNQAAKLDKSADTLVNLSVAHQALNDHQTPIQILAGVLGKFPTNAAANITAVTSLAYLNRREEAHRVGKKFIAFAASNPKLKTTSERISKMLAQLPLAGRAAQGKAAPKTRAARATAAPRVRAPAAAAPAPKRRSNTAIPQVLAPGDPGLPGHPGIPSASSRPQPRKMPPPRSKKPAAFVPAEPPAAR